jgi:hypothetical protein
LLLMDVAGSFQAVPPLTLIGQDMIYHMAHNVLSSNGVLVVNAIASESEIELLGRKLKRSFARVEVLPLPSNYVIFAFPEIEGMPTFGTLKNNERLLSKVGLPPSVWKSMFSL